MAAGKNAVENNALSRDDSWQKKGIKGKLSFTEMTDEERAYYLDKVKQFKELDEKDDKAFLDACAGSGNNTTAACGAQLAKLRAFKEEYEIYFGRYPYSEYLQDDYKKIVRYLDSYSPDNWTYAINNYAKENNISYEEAASKLKPAMYAEKFAEIISLYYGFKGVGIVKGKINAADLAKVDAAINEYNALKQNINKNNWKYAEGEYSQKPTETIKVESPNQISYGDKGTGKGIEGNTLSLSETKIKEILAKEKGTRPDPSTYMSQAEIDAHLAKFDDGAVRFTSKAKYEEFGTYGPNEGFVMPASEFNQLMKETNGDLRILEKKLGLEDGYLSNSDSITVYIPKSEFKNLKIPSGNENGANQFWKPGGKTSGGISEAVMDLSKIKNGVIMDLKKLAIRRRYGK